MVFPPGGIEDYDSLLGGSLHIDIVYSHSGSAYDLEPICCLDHIGSDLGPTAYDQCIVVLYLFYELLGREVGNDINLCSRLKPLHAFLSQ